MSLAQEDIEFIKQHLGEWLTEVSLGKPPAVYEIELRERMVRVEEALKHQGELIQQFIQQMDKRFEQVDLRFGMIEKHFEQIDKRFEQVEKRFEQVDKRFEQIDKRFEEFQQQMDRRFEQVDKRFEQMDQRFVKLQRRMDRFMFWSLGMTLTVGGIVIAVLKF